MSMFRSEAIKKVHPEAVVIDADKEARDKDWNLINLNVSEIDKEEAKLQAEYDAQQYQRDRAANYPELKEQLDLLWHAIDGGKFNVKSKETDFYKKLKAVKDANPKPE